MSTHNRDFARDLGALGMTIRLRRIADRMVHDARRLYRELGLDIEPNWHAVLLLVKDEPGLGVADIARRLGLTHPSTSALVAQMIDRDYLDAIDDPNDGRRRIVRLTRKARRELPKLEQVWEAGRRAIESALDDTDCDVLETITELERVWSGRGYDVRTREEMPAKKTRKRA